MSQGTFPVQMSTGKNGPGNCIPGRPENLTPDPEIVFDLPGQEAQWKCSHGGRDSTYSPAVLWASDRVR
eukprot:1157626-Pelagomonas_calceolata.AAC.7